MNTMNIQMPFFVLEAWRLAHKVGLGSCYAYRAATATLPKTIQVDSWPIFGPDEYPSTLARIRFFVTGGEDIRVWVVSSESHYGTHWSPTRIERRAHGYLTKQVRMLEGDELRDALIEGREPE